MALIAPIKLGHLISKKEKGTVTSITDSIFVVDIFTEIPVANYIITSGK